MATRGPIRAQRPGADRDDNFEGDMALILLEALGAAALLIFIVWWTMFSGRRGGEPAATDEAPAEGTVQDSGRESLSDNPPNTPKVSMEPAAVDPEAPSR